MRKSFTKLQKSLLVLLVFGTLTLGVLAFTTKAGTSIGVTLGLVSAPGGLNNGLVAHWTFDGKDMPLGQVNDVSGQGNHGSQRNTATSTVYTRGTIGQALKFDGSNDEVQVSNFNSITGYPFTLSVWTRHTQGNNGSFRPALSVYITSNTNYHALGWNSSFQSMSASRNTAFDSFTGPTIAINTWAHLVGVYVSATERRLYVNGTLSNTDTSSVTDFTPTSANMGGQSGGYCFCDVDDARIYNRILQTDEIQQLYQLGATTKVAATPSQPPTKAGLNAGLVGHWTFDGKDTPLGQVNDVSGQGNHGSQSQMSTSSAYARGALGQALNFDGADDSVSLSVTSATDLDSNYTLSAWVNPRFLTSGASKATIIKRGASNNLDPGSQYQMRINQSQASFTLAFVTSDGTSAQTDTFGAVPANKWSLVTCTHDGTTKTCYIDGVVSGSPAADTVGNYTGSEAVETIGCASVSCGAGQFAGAIDDVRIYNRVLLLDEIKQLYQLGATTKVATTPTPSNQSGSLNQGLQAHWTFDGKDMPLGQVNDVSGNSRNGSKVSMATATAHIRGPVGQGLEFDGADDTIAFGGSTDLLRNVSVVTFAGWVRPKLVANNVFVGATIGGGGLVNRGTCNADASDGTLTANGRAPDSDSIDTGSVSAGVQANVWQHVVCIIDYANDLGTFYRNGVLIGTAAMPFTNTVTDNTSPTAVRVGSSPNGLNEYTGSLDDIRIYHRALSADEVKQLYQMGQ